MNDTQDLDIVEISKIVVKDVMVKYLFEPVDEVTFSHMEQDIAKGLVAYDIIFMNIDYDIDVDAFEGNVSVTVEIFGIGDTGSVRYVARYVDCPVMSTLEEDMKKTTEELNQLLGPDSHKLLEEVDKVLNDSAFDSAMEIIK